MVNIGGGDPNTIWKGNLMACTWIIQTINIINGKNKNRGIYIWQKVQVPAYKGLWKLKWKWLRQKIPPSILTDAVFVVHWLWNVPGLNKKLLDSTTSQNRVTGCGTSRKIVTYYLLFHLFHAIATLPNGPKNTRLDTNILQQGSIPYQK